MNDMAISTQIALVCDWESKGIAVEYYLANDNFLQHFPEEICGAIRPTMLLISKRKLHVE